MKPARSIVPNIDRTVEAANGARVVTMAGGAVRAIAAAVACVCVPTRRARNGAAPRGSNREAGTNFRPSAMSTRPHRGCRRGTAP
jgi:hypothetical protein